MDFLHRRPSRQQLSEAFRFPSLPFHWQDPPVTAPPTPNADNRRSVRLISRVSTIFSPRKNKNRPPNSEPVSHIAVGTRPRRSDSQASNRTASDASSNDIRPPSGLGFSVDISNPFASNISLPLPSPGRPAFHEVLERSRCISFPEIKRSNSGLGDRSLVTGSSAQFGSSSSCHSLFSRRPVNLPPEVIDVIFSFLPRHAIASLASVSSKFSAAVDRKLYERLDLSGLCNDRLERVSRLLASRWDLAGMVHTLICDSWPPSLPSPPITRLSFLPTQTSPFCTALHNMHHLTSLTLPSFDSTTLRDRTNFRLKSLTFLTRTMSPDQQTELFAWLMTQPGVTSLSFPNLLEPANINKELPVIPHPDMHSWTPDVPIPPHNHFARRQNPRYDSCTPIRPNTKTDAPRVDHLSRSLLPGLLSLHAPPTLVTLLVPARPLLTDITISVRTNLDTGLRPSALMAAVRGVTRLGILFDLNVDKRSVEKVLRAADAAALGDKCQSLDIQVGWLVSEESLYKITHAVLRRFCVLHTLCLRRAVLDTPATPTPEGSLSPSPGLDAAFRSSAADKSRVEAAGENINAEKEAKAAELHEEERVHLEQWLKHCPSLRSVEFLSGAVWHAGEP